MDSKEDDLQVLKIVQGIHAFLNTSFKKISDLQKAMENCSRQTRKIVESNVNNSENLKAWSGVELEPSLEESEYSPKKNDLEIKPALSIKLGETVNSNEVVSHPENQYFNIINTPNAPVSTNGMADETLTTDTKPQVNHLEEQLKSKDIENNHMIMLNSDIWSICDKNIVNSKPSDPSPSKPTPEKLFDASKSSEKKLNDSQLLDVSEQTLSSDEDGASSDTPCRPTIEPQLPRIRVSKNLHYRPLETVQPPAKIEEAEVVEIFPNFFSKKDVYQVRINFRRSVNISEVEELLRLHTELENIVDVTVKNNNATVSFADDFNMRKAIHISKGTLREMCAFKIQPVLKSLELLSPEVGTKRSKSKTPNEKKKKKRIFMAN